MKRLAGKKLAIVPILRAGLGMVDGMVAMIPSCKVGHIGLYRDPETLEPVEYYCKLPPDVSERDVIVVDPMFATGGSASAACTFLKQHGCRHIKLMCIIGAPPAWEKMQKDHPDVDVYVAAMDPILNDHGYIVPVSATPARPYFQHGKRKRQGAYWQQCAPFRRDHYGLRKGIAASAWRMEGQDRSEATVPVGTRTIFRSRTRPAWRSHVWRSEGY